MPDVAKLLNDLGTTADEVAETLRKEGCKGRRSALCDCPVAIYLARHKVTSPRVTNTSVFFKEDTRPFTAPVPPQVDKFIRAFDACAYPDLDAFGWNNLWMSR